MKIKLLGLMLLASAAIPTDSQAGFKCKQTCHGTRLKVVDAAHVVYTNEAEKFESQCQSLGGTTTHEDFGCWLPSSEYGSYRYCVVSEQVQATGYGITTIPSNGGGHFTAKNYADKACLANLGSFACGENFIQAKNPVYDSEDCQEF